MYSTQSGVECELFPASEQCVEGIKLGTVANCLVQVTIAVANTATIAKYSECHNIVE